MSVKFDADMIPVESAGISAVGYDAKRRALGVRFKNGSMHVYDGVSPDDHARLIGAKSIGGHFSQHIRNQYSSTKL